MRNDEWIMFNDEIIGLYFEFQQLSDNQFYL